MTIGKMAQSGVNSRTSPSLDAFVRALAKVDSPGQVGSFLRTYPLNECIRIRNELSLISPDAPKEIVDVLKRTNVIEGIKAVIAQEQGKPSDKFLMQ